MRGLAARLVAGTVSVKLQKFSKLWVATCCERRKRRQGSRTSDRQ